MGGGTYDVAPGTGVVLVDSIGAVTINLPDVKKWVQETAYMPATGFERAIVVKDLGGNAATANITVKSASGQFIDKTIASIVMASANQVLCLLPLRDMSGWYNVSSGVGSGGGGGGGGGTTTATDLLSYSTPAVASAAVIPDTNNFISVAGNRAPDDGGAGVYARVSSLPAPYVGTGFTTMVPPSFTSGVVPLLVYATTAANATVGAPGWGPSIAPIQAGSLAIMVVIDYGAVPSTATDSAGNTYTMAVDFGTANGVGAILYCLNPVFAPTGTTFAIAGRNGPGCLYVYTVAGFTGATFDVSQQLAGAPIHTASPSLATGPLSTQPELVIGVMSNGANPILLDDVPINYTMAPGWIDLSPPIHSRNAIACAVATSTAGITFNPTWSNGVNPSNGVLATFKTFPRAALDASYWQLLPPTPIHTRHFGIDPTTPDNVGPFQFFSQYLATTAATSGGVGAERAGTPQSGSVTISIANPAVITVTSPTFQQPSLRNGSAISFQTTGALPTGIVANQIYYVLYGTVKSILATGAGSNITFQITSTPLFNGTSSSSTKGTAIATSGTQSGTHSITTYGESWTDFVWDPGSYAASNNMAPGINVGLKKTRMLAYGTRIATNINFYGGADRDQNANTSTSLWCYHTQFQTTDVNTSGHQQDNVTLITPAQASNFYVNSWVALMAIDMQQNAGANWNPSIFEFLRIKSVDAVGGVITFYDRMQYNYRSTYPKFTPGTGTGWSGSVDGPATIVQLNDGFDQELEVRGLNIYGVTEGTIGGMKTVRLIDCEMYGWAFDSGPSPAIVRKFTMERCNFHNCVPEVDKMIDTIEYIDCVFDETSYPRLQTASVNKVLVERCKLMSGYEGTAKETVIKDSFITKAFTFGPVYGATDRVTFINSYIGETADSMQEGTIVSTTVVTFTNGTLSIPVGGATAYGTWRAPGGASPAGCPLPWAVPGAKIAICATPTVITNASTSGTVAVGATIGLMKAFTVLDVYVDGAGAFSVDTDLPAFPNTAITLTGTVSGNTLTATAVSPADAWPLAGMTITGGTLPAGTVITQIPGVPVNQLGAYTLNNSVTIGTSTAFTVTNVMHYQPHSCPRLTVINCTGGRTVADMAGAPPDIPLYSYFRRAFTGLPINVNTSERFVRLAGNLLSWEINVLRPYTGAAASYVLNIAVFGYKTASGITYPVAIGQAVNLKLAGKRTITATAVVGNLAGDTLVAVPFWLTGGHACSVGPSLGGGDTLAMMPYFTMTAQTDQGIYPSLVLNAHSGVNEFADTVTQANALW
jgi:hypothetical protein